MPPRRKNIPEENDIDINILDAEDFQKKKERRGRKSKAELEGLGKDELEALKQKRLATRKGKGTKNLFLNLDKKSSLDFLKGLDEDEVDTKEKKKGKPRIWQKAVPTTPLDKIVYTRVCADELCRSGVFLSSLSSKPRNQTYGPFGVSGIICFDRADASPLFSRSFYENYYKDVLPHIPYWEEEEPQKETQKIVHKGGIRNMILDPRRKSLASRLPFGSQPHGTRSFSGGDNPWDTNIVHQCVACPDHVVENPIFIPSFSSYNAWLPVCK